MKEKVIETVKGQNAPEFHDRARRTEGGGEAPRLVEGVQPESKRRPAAASRLERQGDVIRRPLPLLGSRL